MAISGGVKFFEKSQCLFADGATISCSTGNDGGPYAIDLNTDTRWRSVGSADTTTETLEVTFVEEKTISRILLVDHNFKQFQIKYDLAGMYTDFASVTGINGAKANISETAFADDCSYYEFTPVTTTKIKIFIDKTQVADAQKYINQIIVTSELGTLIGYPQIKKLTASKNARTTHTISGKLIVQKSTDTQSFALEFRSYPSESVYSVDMDLMMTIFDRQDPFLVWLCGGRRGSSYFRYTLRGWRLKDVLQMQVSKDIDLNYTDTLYKGGLNAKVQLDEHV